MTEHTNENSNLWDTTFAKLISSEQLVAIYTDKLEDTRFGLGRLLGFSPQYLALAQVDTIGYFDGFRLASRSSIFRIKWDESYAKAREGHARESIPHNAPLSFTVEPNISGVLQECRLKGHLCQFGLEYLYRGIVVDFDDDSVVFEVYDEEKATLNGFCQLHLEDIRCIEIQSQALRQQEDLLRMITGQG